MMEYIMVEVSYPCTDSEADTSRKSIWDKDAIFTIPDIEEILQDPYFKGGEFPGPAYEPPAPVLKESPDQAALPEDNLYRELDTPNLLWELGETDCATLEEVKKDYPQLYQALCVKGIIGRNDTNSSTISDIIAAAQGRAEKEGKVPKKRVKVAETPIDGEPSPGDYITADETSNERSVVGSDYSREINYAKFSRDELREIMEEIKKYGGILPSTDHPFCKKLMAALILTPNGYKKIITIGAEHPRIRKVLKSFGIGEPDGIMREAVIYLFNRAYLPAARGEEIPDEAITSRIVEPYMNENHLADIYGKVNGLPPEEAKKRVLEIGMRAFKGGLEEFTERLDRTEEYLLLKIPAFRLRTVDPY
jgi:hypothetical protein